MHFLRQPSVNGNCSLFHDVSRHERRQAELILDSMISTILPTSNTITAKRPIQNIRATVTSYKASETKMFAVPPPQDAFVIESIDMPHNIATMQML